VLNITENQNLVRPRIGITIGDPAGIGAEVVLKATADEDVLRNCLPVVIGDSKYLIRLADALNLPVNHTITSSVSTINEKTNSPVIYDLQNIRESIELGTESAATGRAAAEYIEMAVKLCLEHKISAVATAPISKNALQMAGYKYPGHTEFLADLTNTQEFAMSFFSGSLRVILLSTHVSLRRALDLIKREPLIKLIRLADRELRKIGVENPRLAVAALNPHAGENCMFGTEETEEIDPAIRTCQSEAINVRGAFPADTIFLRASRGEFDAVIALYHDQATIPVKSLRFGEAVNVTLGLPIIRTSVDHGTAFDIAGKNLAEHSSMKTAIMLAAELSRTAVSRRAANLF
jgi:4-hydroxythreonine-4-phosphate dehydrogenase